MVESPDVFNRVFLKLYNVTTFSTEKRSFKEIHQENIIHRINKIYKIII